jgi:hypothetical protein
MEKGGGALHARRKVYRLVALALAIQLTTIGPVTAEGGGTIELYVDEETGQVFTKPGPKRSRLGTFKRVDDEEKPSAPAPAAAPARSGSEAPVPVAAPPPAPEPAPVEARAPEPGKEQPQTVDESALNRVFHNFLSTKWYERLSLRGYTQFRYTALIANEGEGDWFHPADRSVSEDGGFYIRRARLILSGDVNDHMFVYLQPDFSARPIDGEFTVQLRDAYTDISIDKQREFRFRVGQSKVPFGWVNMQSSQNRLPLERPEALNSAVEGERDVGIFFYWAPAEIRERFKELVSSGLKGSGDYGVFALGPYNGQGLNQLDVNGEPYVVSRLSYPFKFSNGQFFEPGVQAYWGEFVPDTAPIGDPPTAPTFSSNGVTDARVAVSAVLYPQPWGLESEWVMGTGPELVDDDTRIESEFLWGGYVQGYYRWQSPWGIVFPFVRWQYFDGGRKFAVDAPHVTLNEWDFGVEYSVFPALELTVDYAYTPTRTNSRQYPYLDIKNGSRMGLQVQWNY